MIPVLLCVLFKMDRFLKRRAGDDAANSSTKRMKPSTKWGNGSPRSVVAWNCNGLTARIRHGDTDAFRAYIHAEKPDVIFLSETRIAAATNSRGKPGPHTQFYRGKMKDSDKKSEEDANGVRKFLRSEELLPYKVYWSLANTKYAGTAMLLRTENISPPKCVKYSISREDGGEHDSDGRIILVEFEQFSLLHTYVPNNGWAASHFERRRKWDKKMREFMANYHPTNIMWIGDLNVAPTDLDLSHPKEMRRSKKGDVAQCDVGQPGCTDAERERFSAILGDGKLVDIFRKFKPHGKEWSWMGNTGRGMRIDHCIVSQKFVDKIKEFEIVGKGPNRKAFMGSDHSPLFLQLKDAELLQSGEEKNDKVVDGDDKGGKEIVKDQNVKEDAAEKQVVEEGETLSTKDVENGKDIDQVSETMNAMEGKTENLNGDTEARKTENHTIRNGMDENTNSAK